MWYWLIPTWFGSLIAAFFLGYWVRDISRKLAILDEAIKSNYSQPPQSAPEEPKSILVDELDPVNVVLRQAEEEMRRLNP